jgi:hypothetical protein
MIIVLLWLGNIQLIHTIMGVRPYRSDSSPSLGAMTAAKEPEIAVIPNLNMETRD